MILSKRIKIMRKNVFTHVLCPACFAAMALCGFASCQGNSDDDMKDIVIDPAYNVEYAKGVFSAAILPAEDLLAFVERNFPPDETLAAYASRSNLAVITAIPSPVPDFCPAISDTVIIHEKELSPYMQNDGQVHFQFKMYRQLNGANQPHQSWVADIMP
jgi:hypothetical protein